jgi:aspartate kinase
MTFSLPDQPGRPRQEGDGRGPAAGKFVYDELVTDTDVAKVSVVGIGMRSQVGVAAKMFAALAAET